MSETSARIELVPRHSRVTRITHWINVVAITLLLMSGLQIFNAHPALYWGKASHFAEPWVSMKAVPRGEDLIGVTKIGSLTLETTGLFGYSGKVGKREPRGFPAWSTIPGYRSLVDGRHWHFFFAWLFVINGLVYLGANLANGHLKDLVPSRVQLDPRHLWQEIQDHARLRFPKGEEARHYNGLQKLAYGGVVFALLPLMLLTGLTMSPGMNAALPWLVDLFGGRQSARTLHFISASLIVGFILVHLVMVVVSGLGNNLRSMITGRYAIEIKEDVQ